MVDTVNQCGRFRRYAFTYDVKLHLYNNTNTNMHNESAKCTAPFQGKILLSSSTSIFADNAEIGYINCANGERRLLLPVKNITRMMWNKFWKLISYKCDLIVYYLIAYYCASCKLLFIQVIFIQILLYLEYIKYIQVCIWKRDIYSIKFLA